MRDFMRQKPREVVKQGHFPLLDHIAHPVVKFVNDYEQLPKKYKITLHNVSTILLNQSNKTVIVRDGKFIIGDASCIFISDSDAKKSSYRGPIVFSLGPLVQTSEIIRIIAKLHLRGPIFLNGTEVSDISLLMGYPRPRTILWRIPELVFLMYIILLYGAERLDRRQLIINHFTRPRKGLYKIINALERSIREAAKSFLSPQVYYKTKKTLFGVKHFPHRKKRHLELPWSHLKSS